MTKAEWPRKPLGELLSFLTSGSRGWAQYYRESGDLFLRIQNVGKNQMMLDDVAFVEAPETAEAKRTLVQTGDVLLSITADLGRTGVVPAGIGKAYINQHLAILRVQAIHPPFLSAFLASHEGQKQVMGRNKHAVKAGLNFEDIRSFEIPLPPLPEQRLIAEVLDLAEALRAKRRAALAQLDSLTQAIFLEMFGDPATNPRGWPVKTLGDLVEEFRYGSSNKSASSGKPALRIPNVAGGSIDLTNLKLVPVDDTEFERLRLLDGDVLFVRTNGNPDFVGRCAVFDSMTAGTSGFAGKEFIFASYLIRARPAAASIVPVFLREYLLGDEGRRQLRSRSKTSAGQFNINTESLGGIPVPRPPLPLQREFAGRVTSVDALKASHRASLTALDALFASLQHRAFNGEL